MKISTLFDESHNETWTVRPDMALRLSSDEPDYYSYAHLPDLMSKAITVPFEYSVNQGGFLNKDLLSIYNLLFIIHPASQEVHKGTGGDSLFTDAEINSVCSWVEEGGSLFILYEYEEARWRSNINKLIEPFGVEFCNDVALIQRTNGSGITESKGSVFATSVFGHHPICSNLQSIGYYTGSRLRIKSERCTALAFAQNFYPPSLDNAIAAAGTFGRGKIVAIGDTDIFCSRYIFEYSNLLFFLNSIAWLCNLQLAQLTKTNQERKARLVINENTMTLRYVNFSPIELTDNQMKLFLYLSERPQVWLGVDVICQGLKEIYGQDSIQNPENIYDTIRYFKKKVQKTLYGDSNAIHEVSSIIESRKGAGYRINMEPSSIDIVKRNI